MFGNQNSDSVYLTQIYLGDINFPDSSYTLNSNNSARYKYEWENGNLIKETIYREDEKHIIYNTFDDGANPIQGIVGHTDFFDIMRGDITFFSSVNNLVSSRTVYITSQADTFEFFNNYFLEYENEKVSGFFDDSGAILASFSYEEN